LSEMLRNSLPVLIEVPSLIYPSPQTLNLGWDPFSGPH
jgi:hypothetical protein